MADADDAPPRKRKTVYKSVHAEWTPEDEIERPADRFVHKHIPWTGGTPVAHGPCNWGRTVVWLAALAKAERIGRPLRVVPGHEDLWPKERKRGRPVRG